MIFAIVFATSAAGADLTFENAYLREPPPVSHMAAGYAVIRNSTDQDVVLTTASSEKFGLVEFHRTTTENGISKMREMESILVPAGGVYELKPGGAHLMLMRPMSRPVAGETIAIDFSDSDDQRYAVDFVVVNQ